MYEALYRKYRPKTFDDVVGQEYITETLKKQVESNRLNHAYLFIGTRGTGKTTCARILAKAVNCQHPVNGNPCNECASCRGIEDGTILDVVEMDAASNNGVDDVRLLRDEAIFSPTVLKKRVYIIDEVHMLSKPAFNALLKILEEPPEHLMFILATTEANKVLPTILSRCQRHSFRRLDAQTISKRLDYVAQKEGLKLVPEASELLGRLADGGMRDGLSLLDQCSGTETIDVDTVLYNMGLVGSVRTTQMMDLILQNDVSGALNLFTELWQEGKDPVAFLTELSGLCRDALLLRLAAKGGKKLLSGTYDEAYLNNLPANESKLLYMLDKILDSCGKMRADSNPKFRAELCLMELCNGAIPTVSAVQKPENSEPKLQKPVPEKTPIKIATEQPKIAREEPIVEKIPEPQPAEPIAQKAETPAVVSDANVDAIRDAVLKDLNIGMQTILGDINICRWKLENNNLILQLDPQYSSGPWTSAGTLATIKASAEKITQHTMVVRAEIDAEILQQKQKKLEELKKFSNVTFQ